MIYDHNAASYQMRRLSMGAGRWNGAYYYSKELVENIIPKVKTDRDWVTIHMPGMCVDRAIYFVHNNNSQAMYAGLMMYDDLILVCGVPETCKKISRYGRAVYLPLSVDVEYVRQFKRRKTRGTAYVGRAGKRRNLSFAPDVDFLEGMPRDELLEEMSRYRQVYAVGRCAIEAKVLGCEVLPYDQRYPDPSLWKVMDNSEAAVILQGLLDEIDGGEV